MDLGTLVVHAAVEVEDVAEKKLSEDDTEVGSQPDTSDPQLKPLAKSRYTRHEQEASVAQQKAAQIARLHKSDDVVAGVGVKAPARAKAPELEKAETRGEHANSAFRYSNQSDLEAERLLKSDQFYQGSEPSLGFNRQTVQKSACGGCGGPVSSMLTSCPSCGSGASGQSVMRKSGEAAEEPIRKSMAPGMRAARGDRDLVLPNGVKTAE